MANSPGGRSQLSFKLALLVFIGGMLGMVARLLIGVPFQSTNAPNSANTAHSIGAALASSIVWQPILICNLLGSFIAGCFAAGFLIMRTRQGKNPSALEKLAITGFCGGFTTYGTFAYQSTEFLLFGGLWQVILLALVSVVGCVLVCWLGWFVTERIWGPAKTFETDPKLVTENEAE